MWMLYETVSREEGKEKVGDFTTILAASKHIMNIEGINELYLEIYVDDVFTAEDAQLFNYFRYSGCRAFYEIHPKGAFGPNV